MRQALAEGDIARGYRILGRHPMSQRRIAAMTGQSQSEISEILSGRRVVSYDVPVRIAHGPGVPRGLMGLAYCVDGTELDPGPAAMNGREHPFQTNGRTEKKQAYMASLLTAPDELPAATRPVTPRMWAGSDRTPTSAPKRSRTPARGRARLAYLRARSRPATEVHL